MVKVLIESMNHTGEGIGKIDKKIVFVRKTIPGDYVEITNLNDYKKYYRADVKKIIEKSPKRIEAKCPYYDKCGGCQLMNMDYNNQLEYKKEKVINIMKKYANIDINPQIIPSEIYNYRNKITLQVQDGLLGLYESGSNKLIEINECLLATPKTNSIIKIIKNNLDLVTLNQIIIKDFSDNIMITFKGKITKEEVIPLLKDKVSSIYINDSCIYGEKSLIETLNSYKYFISSNSFFQINHNQTIKLYNQVIKYLDKKEENVLDLYCGTGSIGIYISKYCQNITGIEINKSAIEDALKNKELNNIKNIKFKCGNVNKLLKNDNHYTTIILDPPRSGLDKQTINTLLNIKTKKIIYVSCDPITLSRDINTLKEKYQLKDITLLDLFPNTYHVESICLLERK